MPLLAPRSLEIVPRPPRCSKTGTAKNIPAILCVPALQYLLYSPHFLDLAHMNWQTCIDLISNPRYVCMVQNKMPNLTFLAAF